MANSESKEFSIALCGFCDREQKALGSAFKLSVSRPKHYIRWEQGPDSPHICIVNEDLAAGRLAWIDMRRSLRGAAFPVLRVGIANNPSSAFEGVNNVFVKRPVLAIRILKALDDLVSDFYQFSPELSIHDDMATPVVADVAETQAPIAEGAKRILVVDDSESVRTMMEVRLTKMGFSVDFAATGEDALNKAREQSYDLIFLDVMLPGINGFDVSRLLKRNIRVQAPVVMLTGKASRIDKLRGTLASADAYLTKPLSIQHLNETLQRYLG